MRDGIAPGGGRHEVGVGKGVLLSLRVPRSWSRFGDISVNRSIVGPQGAEAMIYWTGSPTGVVADPCDPLLDPTVGPSIADLATAVSTAPGTELVRGPRHVTVGGKPAEHVVVTIRRDLGCDPGYFYTWQDETGGPFWPETRRGDTIRVWIVDVDGARVFIAAETNVQADAGLEQAILRIVGSIRFRRADRGEQIAERFMEARNAHDVEEASSLAADVVTAVLMDDNQMRLGMPTLDLHRGRLALALEAERLLGVRYRAVACDSDRVGVGGWVVTCSYRMDSRLRRVNGYRPSWDVVDLRVVDGHITRLGFPWLSVGFPNGTPPEGADFVEWLKAAHPAASERMSRWMGQEWVFNLSRRTVDDLAGYLDEYERSNPG